MKRTERHHLKENELAQLAGSAADLVGARKNLIVPGVVALVVVALLAGGYLAWRSSIEGRAHALLADALLVDDARIGPPAATGQPSSGLSFGSVREKNQTALTKFKIAADQYPSTDAGLFARYREGTIFMALGTPASAVQSYQQVIDKAGSSLYGQMARLGLAEAQAQTGQFDLAITSFKELAQRNDGQVPIDGVLIRLGRTYLDAGKRTEAEQTFNRIVTEFPDSPFGSDARRELDQLKQT
jgi:TolA-binding protein